MNDDEIRVELVDGRDTFGVIVLGDDGQGNVDVQFKGMKLDRLELAVLLMQMGRELKRQHDEAGEQ